MKKKTTQSITFAANRESTDNNGLRTFERPPADRYNLSDFDFTMILKELEADTQAMLNNIWSHEGELTESILATLNKEEKRFANLLRSFETNGELLKKFLLEFDEDDE